MTNNNREKKKPKPIIGFIGMLLIASALCIGWAFEEPTPTISIILGIVEVSGILIMIYALFTGNIKLFG